MTLINAGTRFAGGTVLHWADDPEGRGALFSGGIFMVVRDRRWVSFMYSIPNFVRRSAERYLRFALDDDER
ncbi:hypothetical protein AB0G67_09770 [Streptomyces sp. NPDC021056]|uniref:hypothetical protein n=1 Tax=Streptomyces sp. NPDC021056 TaxID=3155012 RepID=UPI0033D5CE97